jgi:hypothetical protein
MLAVFNGVTKLSRSTKFKRLSGLALHVGHIFLLLKDASIQTV